MIGSDGRRRPRRGGTPAWFLVTALLACAACQTASPDPPAWISNPPTDPVYLYGIGSYVGALHPEDNQGYAVEQARGMLSRNLRSRVTNTTDLYDTEASSRLTSQTRVSTDDVLQNAELLATWVDVEGRTGRRGTVWVLMRIARG